MNQQQVQDKTHYQAGTYQCQVIDQGFGTSEKKGTPFFFLKFVPSTNDGVQYEREIVKYITENTKEYVIRDLMKLGWDGVNFIDLDTGGDTSFRNQVFEFECKHEVNDGYKNERWDLPFGGGMKIEKEDGVSKKLQTLYGAELKKHREANPAPSQEALRQAANEAKVAASDAATPDIPF